MNRAIHRATVELSHGSSGSRLVTGHTHQHARAEAIVARFHDAEAALIFNSGYDANLALLSTIPRRGEWVFYDAWIHASIRDGIRLGFARNTSFKHNDLNHLKHLLTRCTGTSYVIVESVYSMDGDGPDLGSLVALCARFGARLIVDEAHATGVLGPAGKGLVVARDLHDHVFARVHTFGKAMGVHGAAILGSADLREYLINFARPFIYTTALPPSSMVAIQLAYEHLGAHPEHVAELHQLIRVFKQRFQFEGAIISNSAIQGLKVPGASASVHLASRLQEEGFAVKAMRHPTVPEGQERLRICLHRHNSITDIDRLVQTIKELLR